MMVSAENDPRKAGTIWAMNLDWPLPPVQPVVAATFQRLDHDSSALVGDALGPNAASEFLSRLESGRRCFGARVDGQLAAYGWVSLEDEFIGELNLRIRLLRGEAYIWDCFTLPPFRQQGLYTALLVYIASQLQAERLCRAWIGANLDNIPSQRGIARAGFRPVADLVLARVVALRLVWAQGRPDIPEHLVAEARRAFLGDRDKVWLNSVTLGSRG